jgi:hypothetical protein
MRLKIRKTPSGSYRIDLSIKELRKLEENHKAKNYPRIWGLSEDGQSIILT